MLNILYIITQASWGGAQRHVAALAAHCAKKNNVSVWHGSDTDADGIFRAALQRAGVPSYEIPCLKRAISPFADICALFALARLYRRERPDIVHLHSSKAGVLGSLACALLPRRLRPVIIYTVHGWVFQESRIPLLRTAFVIIEKMANRYRDKIIVLGTHDKETGRSLGLPESKMTVIPNGIDLHAPILSTDEARAALIDALPVTARPHATIHMRVPWIGAIGTFNKNKNMELLVAACAILQKQKTPFHAFIIGGGPHAASLRGLCTRLGLDSSITLSSFLPHAEQFVPAFDMLAITSRKEGLPYILLEAMRAHVPVVATDTGAIRETDAPLIAEPTPDAFAQALGALLTDPATRVASARRAGARVAAYAEEDCVTRVMDLYCSVAAC